MPDSYWNLIELNFSIFYSQWRFYCSKIMFALYFPLFPHHLHPMISPHHHSINYALPQNNFILQSLQSYINSYPISIHHSNHYISSFDPEAQSFLYFWNYVILIYWNLFENSIISDGFIIANQVDLAWVGCYIEFHNPISVQFKEEFEYWLLRSRL